MRTKYETLKTLKALDEHISLLDYKDDYHLDEMLRSGAVTILGMCRALQKCIKNSRINRNPFVSRGGCSTFNAETPDGKVIMGRNFDYKTCNCLVVWTHPKNGYASMSIANQDIILYRDIRRSRRPLRAMGAPYACMDGVNEKGLVCAILEIIAKPTKQNTGKTPISTNFAIRGILDTCADVEEAIRFLENYDMNDLLGACYHYHFTDASGNSAIVEYVEGKMYVYRKQTEKDNLVLTNFFLTPGGDNHQEKGRDRFERIRCALADNKQISENEAMAILESCKVFFRSYYKIYFIKTDWSAVYNSTDRTMLLCGGSDFSRKYRLSLDKPAQAERVS